MPVYQYACTECSEQLEVRQSFTDDALTVCPACSGRLRKVLSAVGVVFKGSGFYRTDSRTDGKPGAATASSTNGNSETPTPAKESTTKESAGSKESSTTSSSTSDSKSPSSAAAPVG